MPGSKNPDPGSFRYLAFHKPYGVLSSFTDPEGRNALKEYVDVPGVYAAGRLDRDSEGLLLLTDDGDLIHRITTPRFHLPKTYQVQVEGVVTEKALDQLRRGVILQGVRTQPCKAREIPDPDYPSRSKPITPHGPTAWLEIILREGKKRQVRHMTAAVGLPTLRLFRVAIGPVTLGDLQPGAWRWLTREEVVSLSKRGDALFL